MLFAQIVKTAITEGTKRGLFFAGGTAAGVGLFAGGKAIKNAVEKAKAEKEAEAGSNNTPSANS
jgi:hypothetical protein